MFTENRYFNPNLESGWVRDGFIRLDMSEICGNDTSIPQLLSITLEIEFEKTNYCFFILNLRKTGFSAQS